jgi:hypothetical protein
MAAAVEAALGRPAWAISIVFRLVRLGGLSSEGL